jgi:hypothetical protein
MEKSQAAHFASPYFKVETGEDDKTNPGIYGQSLARWIAAQLRARGAAGIKDPIAEDWGWCVVVKTSPVKLNVAVSNVEESTTRWRVFAFAERGLLQMFKGGGDLKREVTALREQLAAVLQDVPEMSDLTWKELP